MLSPEERSVRGRIAAYALHAKYDPLVTTAAGRKASAEALNNRLLSEIDPHNILPEAERARRLEYARKAHFGRMALSRMKKARAKREASLSE